MSLSFVNSRENGCKLRIRSLPGSRDRILILRLVALKAGYPENSSPYAIANPEGLLSY
ncbi:MAG TPA: hypothetical protein V6D50_10945 [Chroococcales cyanobacterium]